MTVVDDWNGQFHVKNSHTSATTAGMIFVSVTEQQPVYSWTLLVRHP